MDAPRLRLPRTHRRVLGFLVGALVAALALAACASASSRSPGSGDTGDGAGLGLAGVPRGADPAVAHVAQGVLVGPDGSHVRLPAADGVSAVAGLPVGGRGGTGGLVVADTAAFEGTLGLAHVDADGAVVARSCSGGAPVRDAGATAWVTYTCPSAEVVAAQLHVVRAVAGTATRTEVVDLPGQPLDPPQPVVAGFVHDTGNGGPGSRVVVSGASTGGAVVVDPAGTSPATEVEPVPALDVATGTDGGSLVLGSVGAPGGGGRPVVVDLDAPDGQEVLWRGGRGTRAWAIGDAGLVVGTDGGDWVVWDPRAGEQVATLADLPYQPEPTVVLEATWEDDAHVLVRATAGPEQALLRLGLEGSLERASAVLAPDRGEERAFSLAAS